MWQPLSKRERCNRKFSHFPYYKLRIATLSLPHPVTIVTQGIKHINYWHKNLTKTLLSLTAQTKFIILSRGASDTGSIKAIKSFWPVESTVTSIMRQTLQPERASAAQLPHIKCQHSIQIHIYPALSYNLPKAGITCAIWLQPTPY